MVSSHANRQQPFLRRRGRTKQPLEIDHRTSIQTKTPINLPPTPPKRQNNHHHATPNHSPPLRRPRHPNPRRSIQRIPLPRQIPTHRLPRRSLHPRALRQNRPRRQQPVGHARRLRRAEQHRIARFRGCEEPLSVWQRLDPVEVLSESVL